jgi:hypothetical protein
MRFDETVSFVIRFALHRKVARTTDHPVTERRE